MSPATVEYDFGPVTLYSITSYWHGKLESRGDIDGGFGCSFCGRSTCGPASSLSRRKARTTSRASTSSPRKLRIASNNDGGLGYQAGHVLLRRKSRHPRASTSARRPATDAVGDRQPAPGQQGARHVRLGQLQVRQRPDAAGRRALEPRQARSCVADRLFDIAPGLHRPAARSPRRTTRVKDSVLTWDVSALQEIKRRRQPLCAHRQGLSRAGDPGPHPVRPRR